MNKSLFPYALLFLIVVPIFGFNFLISLIGNVLLLIFLVPILIFLVIWISFNALKTNLKTCNKCGTISLGLNENCSNCGADIRDIKNANYDEVIKPSETTIEVKAEEIK